MKVGESIEEPVSPSDCEHQYVSIHQSDFPMELYWIRKCFLCHRIDGADLTQSLLNAEADRVREENENE